MKEKIAIYILLIILSVGIFFGYFMFKGSSFQMNKNMIELGYFRWNATHNIKNTECPNLSEADSKILNGSFSGTVYNGNAQFWCNLNELKINHYTKNSIKIPDEIGKLINLTNITIGNSEIEGPLPKEIGNLTNLEFLKISKNNITGKIPENYYSLTLLKSFELSQLEIEGNISPEVMNLKNLRELHLYLNNLDGFIPNSIGKLKKLHSLYLQKNNFTGIIPSEIGNIKNLTTFYIHGNNLEKEVPKSILELQKNKKLENFKY